MAKVGKLMGMLKKGLEQISLNWFFWYELLIFKNYNVRTIGTSWFSGGGWNYFALSFFPSLLFHVLITHLLSRCRLPSRGWRWEVWTSSPSPTTARSPTTAAAHGKSGDCEGQCKGHTAFNISSSGTELSVAPVTDSGKPPSLEILVEGSLERPSWALKMQAVEAAGESRNPCIPFVGSLLATKFVD